MAGVFYNEMDPAAAAWLRELMADGLIPAGVVDERDIRDVAPAELVAYRQWHFFAGISVWPYALRCAGWPDDRIVLSGSPPCQSFSSAGKRKGKSDARHLWPELYRIIRGLRPPVFLGEQVPNAVRFGWLDEVAGDLEKAGYEFAPFDLPAAAVGAPHIRQRLLFVARRADAGGGGAAVEPGGVRSGVRPEMGRADDPRGVGVPGVGRPAAEAVGAGGLAHAGRLDGGEGAGRGGVQRGARHVGGSPGGAAREARQQPARPAAADGVATGRVGDADRTGPLPGRPAAPADGHGRPAFTDGGGVADRGLGHADAGGRAEGEAVPRRPATGVGIPVPHHFQSRADGVAHPVGAGLEIGAGVGRDDGEERPPAERAGREVGFWADAVAIHCRDGKARRVPAEPGVQLVADGTAAGVAGVRAPCRDRYPLTQERHEGRVAVLRGAGNAIVAPLAAEFVRAFLEVEAAGG